VVQESDLPVVLASEVLRAIESGAPTIYDHVAIVGDLDLSLIDLPLVHREHPGDQEHVGVIVASRIQIRNCELRGNANFARAVLNEPLDLSGSSFQGEARFKGACFRGEARFEASVFKRYATFRNARFSGDARFRGARFQAIANFGNAVFEEAVTFGSAAFSELCTNFGEAEFWADVDFTEASFSGTANFRLAKLQTAGFWRSKFRADCDFQGARFGSYAGYQSSIFSGNADFRGASFGGELNFEFASFQGNATFIGFAAAGEVNFFRTGFRDVNFEEAELQNDALFQETTFGPACFKGAHFQGSASFRASRFNEDVSFPGCIFEGPTRFDHARFLGGVDFEDALFMQCAQFSEDIFQSNASFDRSRFCAEATFLGSQFSGKTHFSSVKFEGDGIFTGTQFAGLANFSAAEFHEDFLLDGARAQEIRLLGAAFDGQVSLQNANFARLDVRWPSICGHLAYDGAAYLSLAKNFRNLEWFEDADDCYYHYRRKSQANKRLLVREGRQISINWSKLLDCLALVSCGYGVRPRYTVFLSILLIFVFALLFWAGQGIVEEPLNGSAPNSISGHLTFLDNLYFSTMVFTAKTQVKWYPVGIYRYLATVESVLGWLLLALFLVTLGRTMIR